MWLTPIWFSQCDLKSQNVTLYLIIWVGCLIWLYISKCDIIFYNFILRSPNVTFPNLTFSQCDVKSHVTLYLKIWLIFINQNMTLPPNLTLYLTVWRYIFQWLFHFKPFLTIKVTLWHTDTVRSFFFFCTLRQKQASIYGALLELAVYVECSGSRRWVQQWCGLMPALLSLCLHLSISLSLFALFHHSLCHSRSTSESLYGEEMVIASSIQPSEWPDLTGSLLQPLWLYVLFSHSHSPFFCI